MSTGAGPELKGEVTMTNNRLIELADEAGDFVTGDDGFTLFWPDAKIGGFSSTNLRVLADEIDRRNQKWAALLELYMRSPPAEDVENSS